MVMDQLVTLCKPNKKVWSEKIVNYIPQTRHLRLFLVMLASVGYMEVHE